MAGRRRYWRVLLVQSGRRQPDGRAIVVVVVVVVEMGKVGDVLDLDRPAAVGGGVERSPRAGGGALGAVAVEAYIRIEQRSDAKRGTYTNKYAGPQSASRRMRNHLGVILQNVFDYFYFCLFFFFFFF